MTREHPRSRMVGAPDDDAIRARRAAYERPGRTTDQERGYAGRRFAGRDDDHALAASHAGRGPKGYVRRDARILDDVCRSLAGDRRVDASAIEVTVQEGEVVLVGVVDDRAQKRAAEDLALAVVGVKDVHNRLRLRPR